MFIDIHAHHLTPGMFDCDPFWGPKWTGWNMQIGDYQLHTKAMPKKYEFVDGEPGESMFERMDHPMRRQLMAKLGVDALVVSISPLQFMYWAGDFGVDYMRICNDELARWCAVEPERFFWWASAPMHRPEVAADELERAIKMGAVGLYAGAAGLGDLELHSPEMDVVWSKAAELDVPVFLHAYPRKQAEGTGVYDEFNTGVPIGYLNDETTAFWNLICGGVLDRFQSLTFYITHGGGFVPYQYERFAENLKTLGYGAVNEKPLEEYFPRFVFDPMIHNPTMRRAMVDVIGIDRLVYGSNFGGSDGIEWDLTEGIGLSHEERERIKGGNAIKLLKLENRLAGAAA
jgi:aminocarboxymuconate-semialdehyde decarboxylase